MDNTRTFDNFIEILVLLHNSINQLVSTAVCTVFINLVVNFLHDLLGLHVLNGLLGLALAVFQIAVL